MMRANNVYPPIRAEAPRQALPGSIVILGDAADLEITAAAADENGEPKLPTCTMLAYSGGRLDMNYWSYPVYVDLSGLKAERQTIPLLRDHDRGRIVGHATEIKNDGKRLTVVGVMSGVGQDTQEIVATAKNKFPWQSSIGANPKEVEFVDQGAKAQVNGRSVSGPAYIVRQAVLGEVSFVAIGADTKSAAKVAARGHENKEGSIMGFEAWLTSKGFDIGALSDVQRAALEAAYKAETAPVAKPAPAPVEAGAKDEPDPLEDSRKRWATEIRRREAIQKICAGRHHEIEAKAIEEGWTTERVELEVLRLNRPTGPAIHAGGAAPNAGVIEASMLLSLGFKEQFVAASYGDQTINAAMQRENRGQTLVGAMHSVLLAAGRSIRPGRIDDDFIRATFEADRTLRASGTTTVSLSGILSNVANKALIASYDAQQVAWPLICGVRNHRDFKTHTRYRLDSTGSFKKVGPDGELKHVGLDEAQYTNKLDTYGAIIALTRPMIINDDLGAFAELPSMLGRMSAVRIEEAVFSLLLSNPNDFFDADNNNVSTGVFGITGVTNAETVFANMADSNGKPVLITPRVLLVPTTLKSAADVLNTESTIIGTTTADRPLPARNPHVGKFIIASSPYLNNTAIRDQDGNAISGQSSVSYYLAADPGVRAAIAVAFLNGNRVPAIESSDVEFSQLGMQWRAYHDFGVGMEDPNAMVKSSGA